MDSGWAVVLGAFIALVGSVVTPWLKDRIEGRVQREEARRREIRSNIEAMVRALGDLLQAEQLGKKPLGPYEVEATIVYTRFALSLDARDAPISAMIATTINTRAAGVLGIMLTETQGALHRWYQGQTDTLTTLADWIRNLRGRGIEIEFEGNILVMKKPVPPLDSHLPSAPSRPDPHPSSSGR